jgi:hypothetical protein
MVFFNIRQTHLWVVLLGTTSRNGEGTKIDQIIFLGLFLKMFSQQYFVFFQAYFLHALIYGLEFFVELKKNY